jgi:hypothetical protein
VCICVRARAPSMERRSLIFSFPPTLPASVLTFAPTHTRRQAPGVCAGSTPTRQSYATALLPRRRAGQIRRTARHRSMQARARCAHIPADTASENHLFWSRAVRRICPAAFVLDGAALAQVAPWPHVPIFVCLTVSAHCRTFTMSLRTFQEPIFSPPSSGQTGRVFFLRSLPEQLARILSTCPRRHTAEGTVRRHCCVWSAWPRRRQQWPR